LIVYQIFPEGSNFLIHMVHITYVIARTIHFSLRCFSLISIRKRSHWDCQTTVAENVIDIMCSTVQQLIFSEM
jgi:hypothetical protein